MLRTSRNDVGASIWVGEHEVPLDSAAVAELAAFLDADAVERVWASAEPLLRGGLEFVRADGTHLPQHERDVKRRRVVVRHGQSRWHLLPDELEKLGAGLRALTG